jgi:hypothetical protein
MRRKRVIVSFQGGPLDGESWKLRGEDAPFEEIVVDGFLYKHEAIDTGSSGLFTAVTHARFSEPWR